MSEYNNLTHSISLHVSPISLHIMKLVPVSPLSSFILFPSFHFFCFLPAPTLALRASVLLEYCEEKVNKNR